MITNIFAHRIHNSKDIGKKQGEVHVDQVLGFALVGM